MGAKGQHQAPDCYWVPAALQPDGLEGAGKGGRSFLRNTFPFVVSYSGIQHKKGHEEQHRGRLRRINRTKPAALFNSAQRNLKKG